jgi:DNA invertase Pin-like site-specific DNA recombinase
VQRDAIETWARRERHSITAWHSDEGMSGSNGLDTRVGLLDAIDALRSGHAGGLVVYRLDRLARDLILQEQLLADMRRLGAEIFTTSDAEAGYLTDDPDDPSRRMIRQILGSVNEYERGVIALRLRSGRRRKAANGGYAYGAPRFGTRAEHGELVADDNETRVVTRVRELRAAGLSYRQVCDALEAEGTRPRRAGRWAPAVVRRIALRS